MTTFEGGFPGQLLDVTYTKVDGSVSYPLAFPVDVSGYGVSVRTPSITQTLVLGDTLTVVDDSPDIITATFVRARVPFKDVNVPLTTKVNSASVYIEFTVDEAPTVDDVVGSDPVVLGITIERTPTRLTELGDDVITVGEFMVIEEALSGTSQTIDVTDLIQEWTDRNYPVTTGESFALVFSCVNSDVEVGSVGVTSTSGFATLDASSVVLTVDYDVERAFDLRSESQRLVSATSPILWLPMEDLTVSALRDDVTDFPVLDWRSFFIPDDYSKWAEQPIDLTQTVQYWHNFYSAEQDPEEEIVLGNDDLFNTGDSGAVGADLTFDSFGTERWSMVFNNTQTAFVLASGAPTGGGAFTPALSSDWSMLMMIKPTSLAARAILGFSSSVARYFQINNSSGALQINLGSSLTSSNGAIANNTWQLVRISHLSGTTTVHVNEVEVINGNAGTNVPDYLWMGQRFGLANRFVGSIGIFGVYEGDVTQDPNWLEFYEFTKAWYGETSFQGDLGSDSEVSEQLPMYYYGDVVEGASDVNLASTGWLQGNLTNWTTHKPVAADILDTGTYTISCWFSTESIAAFTLFRYADRGIWLSSPGDGMIDIGHYDNVDALWYARSETNWSDGVYHHVCATYDGTTLKLYMDGVEAASELADPVDFLLDPEDGFTFGRNGPFSVVESSDLFDGRIKRFFLTSRVLDPAEVFSVFSATDDDNIRYMEPGKVGFV